MTVHDPICTPTGSLADALYGSFFPAPDQKVFAPYQPPTWLPGALRVKESGPIVLCPSRARITLQVTNTGDRPIQVGSHYPFAETNGALRFARLAALGYRLDIAAGTAVRFEPGDSKPVNLVAIGGARVLAGGSALFSGPIEQLNLGDAGARQALQARLSQAGFLDASPEEYAALAAAAAPPAHRLSREQYASLYGPTTGDRVRLADTELWIEVERDLTSYGDECKFGGGQSARRSPSASHSPRRLQARCCATAWVRPRAARTQSAWTSSSSTL